MRKSLFKLFLVLALGAVICLPGVAQADFSWQTQPILGHSVTDTGDLVIVTDNGSVTIPHVNIPGDPLNGVGLPGVTQFFFNPDTLTGGHWTDMVTKIGMGSGVYLNTGTTYTWTSTWSFLGTPGNSTYDLTASGLYNQGQAFVMLMSTLSELWLEDAGNWRYTQSWLDNTTSATITSTPVDFNLAVPLPPSVLLLGSGLLGLMGLGWRRRRKS